MRHAGLSRPLRQMVRPTANRSESQTEDSPIYDIVVDERTDAPAAESVRAKIGPAVHDLETTLRLSHPALKGRCSLPIQDQRRWALNYLGLLTTGFPGLLNVAGARSPAPSLR